MATNSTPMPIDERWATDKATFSLCARCKHKTLGAATCTAFPGGIPLMFLNASEKHTKKFWDETVTFEKVE